MTVPLTSGSADASAGIWPCSQQISTVPVPLVSTGGGELRLLSLGEVGRYLDAEPVRQPADRLMGSVVSGLDRVSVGRRDQHPGNPESRSQRTVPGIEECRQCAGSLPAAWQ
jgi:hypothetical protein